VLRELSRPSPDEAAESYRRPCCNPKRSTRNPNRVGNALHDTKAGHARLGFEIAVELTLAQGALR